MSAFGIHATAAVGRLHAYGILPESRRPRLLKPKDIWAIRIHLQYEHRASDLAMFNLAIDSKLRGCDLVHSARKFKLSSTTTACSVKADA